MDRAVGARNLAAVADEVYKNQLLAISELNTANNEFLLARLAVRDAFLFHSEQQRLEKAATGQLKLIEDHVAKYKATALPTKKRKRYLN